MKIFGETFSRLFSASLDFAVHMKDQRNDQQKFDSLQIEELATGDFIRRQSNLIFVAQRGP